jgi:hypothetical protein
LGQPHALRSFAWAFRASEETRILSVSQRQARRERLRVASELKQVEKFLG